MPYRTWLDTLEVDGVHYELTLIGGFIQGFELCRVVEEGPRPRPRVPVWSGSFVTTTEPSGFPERDVFAPHIRIPVSTWHEDPPNKLTLRNKVRLLIGDFAPA